MKTLLGNGLARARLWASVKSFIVTASTVFAAFAIGAVIIIGIGQDPLRAYSALFLANFGSIGGMSEMLIKGSALALISEGLVFAFRSKAYNIGAEGQLYVGAVAAVFMAFTFSGTPAVLLLPLMLLAGASAGVVWALVPAILKVKLGVSEIINTVMMNFIATLGVSYLVEGPWRGPGAVYPRTAYLPLSARLPILIPGTRLHAGFLMAFLFALVAYVFLQKSKWGYEIRAVGENPVAARYAGISPGRSIIIAMAVSGGMAGISGVCEVSGVHHLLRADVSPGYGFTAIIVTLLGKLHPLGVVPAAFLFATLEVGAYSMQLAGVPMAIAWIIKGLTVLFTLISEVSVIRKIVRRDSRWFSAQSS